MKVYLLIACSMLTSATWLECTTPDQLSRLYIIQSIQRSCDHHHTLEKDEATLIKQRFDNSAPSSVVPSSLCSALKKVILS